MDTKFKTSFGKLLDVYGAPVESGGIRIVPADVKLEGFRFSFEFPLSEHLTTFPPILRAPIVNGYDAAWVRGRIPRVFGFAPGPSEGEKSLFYLGFVAVMPEWSVVFPFLCTDYYGRTSLVFSQSGPDLETRRLAASAFWEALLTEPDDLIDFSTRVPHLGAPVVLEFGCDDGEPYLVEHDKNRGNDDN